MDQDQRLVAVQDELAFFAERGDFFVREFLNEAGFRGYSRNDAGRRKLTEIQQDEHAFSVQAALEREDVFVLFVDELDRADLKDAELTAQRDELFIKRVKRASSPTTVPE